MKRTEIFEQIQAATPTEKVLLLSFLTGNNIPVTADLLDEDVPLWKNVKDIISVTKPFRINFPTGEALPLVFSNFQLLYSQTGSVPKVRCRKITGGGWLTASITNSATSATDGTYTAQAMVNDSGVYSATGIGNAGTATFIVSGGIVTSVTKVSAGSLYNVGDTFTCAALPGAVFTIASGSEFYYEDLTAQATISIGEVTDEIPDSISINVDDDGSGILADAMQIIFSN
ncbi:hypothetical protein [Mucilaginibacter xinganensis]|uniref:Uncharacterized protein n=1 Tax=Mucilaginibacter xinganensis TaxID=1234841 RepID=A0A223NXK1_9SPHI|nr:hypothetical protein [Mucilaginibacter xinganensis]ASU34424.1 hypothetical protein MuYL_2537 [Mucilaginibacter xinganensis]